ncbi:MAG: hypothetical protein JSS74_14165 [Actinobacteria bacterium]|nr:hypothetical protein [Actinomycetota bacterium]
MRRPHELRVPGSVPAPVLRVAAAAVILGGTLLLNPFPMWWWIAAAAATASAIVPRSMASWIGIACMPVGLALTAPSPMRTASAVLLIHLAHVLAAWAWAVPWRSRIRVAVLLPGVRRLLLIQAIAQAVAALVVLAVPPLHGPGFAWLAPLGAALLAGASAALLRVSGRSQARSAEPGPESEPASEPVGGSNVRGRS